MESLAAWFANTLGQYISANAVVFIVSLCPILECRGGLIVASLLQVPIPTAVLLCIVGNALPVPFILLFIRHIFKWLKKFDWSRPWIEKLEAHAMNRSSRLDKGEFIGLLLFVGIPLPGTGAWTGSLIAALLEMDIKKATLAAFLGILLATVIVGSLSYGLLGVL
ncbi:MAG: small multi-drug export protein [Erysipelotrichaceae bacterium]|nr:small multi-drug export protein [Erysipelotrichaceae bacterium]